MASPGEPVNFDQRINTIRSDYDDGAVHSIYQFLPAPRANEKGRHMAAFLGNIIPISPGQWRY
ncbi:hypothetical protein [Aeromonas hydrophila]|uniref:hypothetical protein n=1 Tax=Aeromonas hydrophila TaxID=644 RepID=UPI001116D58C|nr:hypothetical protein [Aeromonas hydrophila]